MKKFLKIFIVVIIILLVIGAVIFGMNNSKKKDENTLVIGMDNSFPPMGFRNENNEIVGFDIDFAYEVCKELGMNLEIQTISWAAKEQELDSGNIDCIWNGFAKTEEREEAMTLSEPYIRSEMLFLVNKDSEYESQESLQGKKIGVQAGSSGQKDLENSDFGKGLEEIVQYGDYLSALMDLETGNIDGVFISAINANYLKQTNGKDFKQIKSEGISTAQGMVIAYKKGNTELRDKIQEVTDKLIENGKMQEISQKWFGDDLIAKKDEGENN